MDIFIPRHKSESPAQTMHDVLKRTGGYEAFIQRRKVRDTREMRELAIAEGKERRKTVDGLGQVVSQIPLHLYTRLVKHHGDDMKDPAFRKALLRDNPELRATRPERKPR